MKIFRLKKAERLCKKKDFDRIFKEGETRGNSIVSLRLLPNQLKYSRLGVAVGIKRVRSAVKRNRLKRLIREAFRLNKSRLPKGVDIVIVLRKVDKVSLDEISNSVLRLIG